MTAIRENAHAQTALRATRADLRALQQKFDLSRVPVDPHDRAAENELARLRQELDQVGVG